MGGQGAWRKLAPPGDTSTPEEIKRRQQAWRNTHPETVSFWGALNRAAKKAIQKPGEIIACKRVGFEHAGEFLFMHLPSGRRIAYPFAHLHTNGRGDPVVVFMDNEKGKWAECRGGQGAYGGTWIENAVQAMRATSLPRPCPVSRPPATRSRCTCMTRSSPRCRGFGSPEEFLRILTTPPSWAEGLPIAAKVRVGQRFCKITPPKIRPDAIAEAAPEVDVTGTEEPPFDLEGDVLRT